MLRQIVYRSKSTNPLDFSQLDSIASDSIPFNQQNDDFGAGFAGLSLLAQFLPDKIKLDRAITNDIHEDGPRQAIAHTVLEFANSMGIPLIVEGVETIEEWLWLQNIGIRQFQGYLFARPTLNGIGRIEFSV